MVLQYCAFRNPSDLSHFPHGIGEWNQISRVVYICIECIELVPIMFELLRRIKWCEVHFKIHIIYFIQIHMTLSSIVCPMECKMRWKNTEPLM